MNRKQSIRIILLVVLCAFAFSAQAQRRNQRYEEYIERYSPLAVEQMRVHKIPASITLAQGLLESGPVTVNLPVKAITILV